MSLELIRKQIAATNAAFGVSFDSNPDTNLWLINQISDFLVSRGVESIADLAQTFEKDNPPEWTHQAGDIGWVTDVSPPGTYRSYFINKKTGKNIAPFNPAFPDREYIEMPMQANSSYLAIFFDDNYVWNYRTYLQFTKGGFPVFTVSKYHSDDGLSVGSVWRDALANFAPIAPIVLAVVSVVVPGLGLVIGQAIGGALGIADAVICQYIGNFALSIGTNGGNIEGAIQSMVFSYVGSGVSSNIAGLTDSRFVGNVAGATVRAAISGGNVNNAALYAVIGNVGNIDTSGVIKMDDAYELDSSYDDYGNETVYMSDGTTVYNNMDGSSYVEAENGTVVDYYTGEIIYQESMPETIDNNSPLPEQIPRTGAGSNITFNDVLKAIPQIAQVWRSVGNPSPVSGNRQTLPNGSIVTPNKNGTVTTVSANGQVSNARMQPGVPYYFSDGSYVTVDSKGNVINVSQTGQLTQSKAASTGGGNGAALAAMAFGLVLMNN